MRRASARGPYWEAEGSSDCRSADCDSNISPRHAPDSENLLGVETRLWNDEDVFGTPGDGDRLPGGVDTNKGVSPMGSHPSGGGGGSGGPQQDKHTARRSWTNFEGGVGHGLLQRGHQRRPRRFFLRIHKFVFQKELALHFSMCILSIAIPFSLSGSPWLAAIPLSMWCFYNVMFVVGAKRAGAVLPGFDRFKRSFVAAMQEFLPPRLVPVLSLSFLSVLVAVSLTGAKLGGPPLCVSTCRACLRSWQHAKPIASQIPAPVVHSGARGHYSRLSHTVKEGTRYLGESGMMARGHYQGMSSEGASVGDKAFTLSTLRSHRSNTACGYANGKELLAFYTVSQSAILIYLAVMTGLLTCLAWKISGEELDQREAAESRLKAQNPKSFELRERMILDHGRPGSSVRPETTTMWLMFGLVAAFTFTLIGWRKWEDLPSGPASGVVIGANVMTTVGSVLMLHVGFHGRLVALYQGNLDRVHFLSKLLREGIDRAEDPWIHEAEAWWFLRSFVLREDLSLDYDVGGLGVSATFFIVLVSFVVALVQICREGLDAMLNPPGSYCAYASLYLTACLIRIFGLATKTYLEQQKHIGMIQDYSDNLMRIANDEQAGGWLGDTALPSTKLSLTHVVVQGSTESVGARQDIVEERVSEDGVDIGIMSARKSGDGQDGVKPAREALHRMILQMKEADPYPCVLGIPVKPALFATSKIYVFICFAVISTKLMYDVIVSYSNDRR